MSAPANSDHAAPHTPAAPDHHDRRAARIGLILFALYCGCYGTFMLLAAFAPRVMATVTLPGITLSVIFGLGLIIGAFLLAVAYLLLARESAAEQKVQP